MGSACRAQEWTPDDCTVPRDHQRLGPRGLRAPIGALPSAPRSRLQHLSPRRASTTGQLEGGDRGNGGGSRRLLAPDRVTDGTLAVDRDVVRAGRELVNTEEAHMAGMLRKLIASGVAAKVIAEAR